jgi:hypothetical protein
MENEKEKLDIDALMKAGASSVAYCAASLGIGCWTDHVMQNKERLEYLKLRIEGIEYGLSPHSNAYNPEVWKAFGHKNPEEIPELAKQRLKEHQNELQGINFLRNAYVPAILGCTALIGFVAYQHFHHKNEQLLTENPENSINSVVNTGKLNANNLELNEEKKR